MKKIYLAGAYSDNNVLGVLKNIGRGEYYASLLFKHGFAPFTPWHDKSFVITHFKDEFDVQKFYDYSIEWLLVSDALLIVPNIEGLRNWQDSPGTVNEIKVAEQNDIPVFYNIEDMIKYFYGDVL